MRKGSPCQPTEAGLAPTEAAGHPFGTKPRASSPRGAEGLCPPAWLRREHGPGRPVSSRREEPALPLNGRWRRGRTLGAGASLGAAPGARWASGAASAEQAAGAAAGSSRAGLGASPGDVVPQATTSATWPLRLSFRQQRRRAPQGARGQGGRPGHRSPQGTLPGGRPGLQASRPPSPVTSVHCMSAVTAAQLLPQGQ